MWCFLLQYRSLIQAAVGIFSPNKILCPSAALKIQRHKFKNMYALIFSGTVAAADKFKAACYAGGYFNLPWAKAEYHLFRHLISHFCFHVYLLLFWLLFFFFFPSTSLTVLLSSLFLALSLSLSDKMGHTVTRGNAAWRHTHPHTGLVRECSSNLNPYTHIQYICTLAHTYTHSGREWERLGTPSIHKKFFFFSLFHLPIHTLTHTHFVLLQVIVFRTTSQQNSLSWHAGLCGGRHTHTHSPQPPCAILLTSSD